MKNIDTAFRKILNLALELNNYNRGTQVAQNALQQLSIPDWLREFGTIHLNVGRHTGKSIEIRAHILAAQHNVEGQQSCVIAHDQRIIDMMYGEISVFHSCTAYSLTAKQACRGWHTVVSKHRFIFIEEPEKVFSIMPKCDFYSLFMEARHTVILLGE